MTDYLAKYPKSFKAPFKLVFTHPETEDHYAGEYSISFGEDLLNTVLNAILEPPPVFTEDGKPMYRAHIISDLRIPKFHDEDGNLVPYNFVVVRKKSGTADAERRERVDERDDQGQKAE